MRLSQDPRSDAFLLFALPLLSAADEFCLSSGVFIFALTLASFAVVLYSMASSTDQVRQFGTILLPRSVFLTMLMAAWATVVRSLRIKEEQLMRLVDFNDELSKLKTTREIARAASLAAAELTGAESATV